jgi:hypothetical protein
MNTMDVRVVYLPYLVKTSCFFNWNQQVTNSRSYASYLVGTSETTRAASFDENETNFNQWLAGLIDGDGSLLVSKAGYTSCEITMSLQDEHTLRIIQNKLGGTIKVRSGVRAIRYRLHNKLGMLKLISRINGLIRHTSRIKQLNNVCATLNIPCLTPDSLHNKHGWFAGFFDADGTIGFSIKGKYSIPQLTLSVTNKLLIDVVYYQNVFGGNIYYDKAHNGYYKWTIQSESDILSLFEYFKYCPSRSIKRKRLFLIKEYYKLVKMGAYKAPIDSAFHKA